MYANIVKLFEELHYDNNWIPLTGIDEKLSALSDEEMQTLALTNGAEPQFWEICRKAGLDDYEIGILIGVLECAFGECVDHLGKINLVTS